MYIRPDSLKQNVGLQKGCKTERYNTKKINIYAKTLTGEIDKI